MTRTRSARNRPSQFLLATVSASTLLVACSPRDGGSSDSAAVSASDTGRAASAVSSAGAADGGKPVSNCNNTDASVSTPKIVADLSGKNPSEADQAAVVKYLTEKDLCFARANGQAHDDFKPKTGKILKLTIRSEWRMPETNPEKDLAKNDGMVVAQIQNHEKNGDYPDQWDEGLASEDSAYMWFGVNNSGDRYSRIFTVTDWTKGQIRILANGKASGSNWKHEDYTHDKKARAHWNAQHKNIMQPNGSGWIACLAGCCTALNLNVSDP